MGGNYYGHISNYLFAPYGYPSYGHRSDGNSYVSYGYPYYL